MPTAYWNQEFLNLNTQRTYPLAEHASKVDVTNSIQIPDSFLVEVHLPISTALETLPDKFFIRRLSILGGGYMIEVGYDNGSGNYTTVASASIPELNFTEYSMYSLIGTGSWEDSIGNVVIGSLDAVAQLPAGIYSFTPDSAPLDPDTIRPMIRGVTSIITEQGGQRGPKLRNNVVLRSGSNLRISTSTGDDGVTVIRFDAIPDSATSGANTCLCIEKEAPCIKTINNVPGDSRQNFTLLGDGCLKVESIANGLQLTDDCCKPCCGCEELAEIVRALRNVESTSVTLDSFMQRLNTAQTTLHAVLLNTKPISCT